MQQYKKTLVRAIIATLVAILVAYFIKYGLWFVSGYDAGSALTDKYEASMSSAKSYFVELSEPVQEFTHWAVSLPDVPDYIALRGDEGWALLHPDGTLTRSTGDGTADAALDALFGENEAGVSLCEIVMTADAVEFYTEYNAAGFVGFLYEKTLGETGRSYDLIELVENWQIFYVMN